MNIKIKDLTQLAKVCMAGALIALVMCFLYIGVIHAQVILPAEKTIAMVIAAEACGEGSTGMYAIASVIKNRADKWGKTPYEIVTAKNQFYGLHAKNRHKLYRQCEKDATLLEGLILDGSLDDITDGALYFRQHKEPRYSWHEVKTWEWKGHVFYR